MSTLECFYVQPEDVDVASLILRQQEAHHLVRVNRQAVGDFFVAVNGRGAAYRCQIEEIGTDYLRAKITEQYDSMGEPSVDLTIALAVPAKDRLEWVIEKGTELGASKFVLLVTERTLVKEHVVRLARLQRVALAAMKQCRRSLLPIIEGPMGFESYCEGSTVEGILRLVAHEKGQQPDLAEALKMTTSDRTGVRRSAMIGIGPEGGFTEAEIAIAENNGFTIVGLGTRRLRSETAAIAAASVIMDRMQEFE